MGWVVATHAIPHLRQLFPKPLSVTQAPPPKRISLSQCACSCITPPTRHTTALQVLHHRLEARVGVQPQQHHADGRHVAHLVMAQPQAGQVLNLCMRGHGDVSGGVRCADPPSAQGQWATPLLTTDMARSSVVRSMFFLMRSTICSTQGFSHPVTRASEACQALLRHCMESHPTHPA